MKSRLLLVACVAALPALALAQGMQGQSTSQGDQSASSKAFEAANDKMTKNMMVPMTGDADRDFAMMMMAHHQGAIDMAKVELEYGHDPQLRKMAEDIIQAQAKEIDELKTWQQQHPK